MNLYSSAIDNNELAPFLAALLPFIFLYHLGVSYYIPPIVALKLLLLSFVKDETHEVAALVDPHQEMHRIRMY